MPWVNVIANPHFGTIVTASGAAHTWAGNSRENRLTPFANDPISDPTGEAHLHPRRRDRRRSWSPTPGPLPRPARRPVRSCATRAGLTRFSASTHGDRPRARRVRRRRTIPVKFSLLTLTNSGDVAAHA